MKKLIVGMMAAAFALGAFCEGEDNNPLIVSDNLFGSIKLDTKSEFTMVAAPFEGFASQFEDSKVDLTQTSVANTILVRDVVAVEKLIDTDTLSVFNPAATDDKTEFDNYIARLAQVKIGKVTYSYMEWLASMWFEEETMISHKFDDPDKRLVPTGSGVFIGRDVDKIPSNGFSIYAYGQIPQSFPTDPIEIGTGKTMLCPPGELAYADVDLNKDVTFGGDIIEVSGRVGTVNGVPALRPTTDSLAGADRIKFYRCTGVKAQECTLYRCNNVWYGFEGTTTARGYANLAVIPAGQSFWFIKGGSGTATLQW